jgi:Asp-tRNA(Asn)/Glu-tRNA(Gln) amidotransferase A subunit family amidase
VDRFNPAASNLLGASEARALIETGALTSCELVAACLARIDELEPTIGA